jgi:hypothetical protein
MVILLVLTFKSSSNLAAAWHRGDWRWRSIPCSLGCVLQLVEVAGVEGVPAAGDLQHHRHLYFSASLLKVPPAAGSRCW